jgi:16S rRNA (uracil1498-N3)-methyltransferase
VLRVPVTHLAVGELMLDEAASRYVARVHRIAAGETILLFDPATAREGRALIVEISRHGVRCSVASLSEPAARPRRPITLLQGLGKGDKFDHIVRDATELGATHVVAVESARTVVKLGERKERRLARWQRVASEAARQSGRADAPRVSGPLALAEALALADADAVNLPMRLCLWEGEGSPIGQPLRALGEHQPLMFLVGPEGGLAAGEVELARAHGYLVVSLGPVILRTETVATAVLGGLLLLHA